MKEKKTKTKKIIILTALSVAFLAISVWIAWGNSALEVNEYTVASEKLPEAFDGFRIAHISDLHNTQFGDDNEKLLKMIEDSDPDMIAITGDLVDSRRTNIDVALHFAEKAVKIAPCYYVTGNHEAGIPDYDKFKAALLKLGVVVLENESSEFEYRGEKILLMGIEDPLFREDYSAKGRDLTVRAQLSEISREEDLFTVLLSHRPEVFDVYVENDIDLALAGHLHGGQFRLPFVGGVFAPSQGFFPEYDAGRYEKEETTMVVSRGIGNSIFPFRINNRPEVLIIELSKLHS